MFERLKTLYTLLNREQRKRLVWLQVLVVLMAFAEVGGVVAIGPFMSLVGDMGQLEGDGILAETYRYSGFSDPADFLFWLGIAVLVALTIGAVLSIVATWHLSIFAHQVGADLASRLYKHYMYQPWLFHAGGSSSQLTNKIAQESQRLTNTILKPLMLMNAKAVLALVMAAAIFIYNPVVAVAGLLLFSIAYLLLYKVVRTRLARNGRVVTETNRQRFKLMNEGFGGIKDTLLLGRQEDFNERFEAASSSFGRAMGVTQALSQVPRYAMELIAFGGIIFLVLYLLSSHEGNLGTLLPVLSVYALAGFKLLPAFQQVYSGVSEIRGNLAAFDNLEPDLIASREDDQAALTKKPGSLAPKHEIRLEDVTFHYPDATEPALEGLSIEIPVNNVIGLVGSSGSGKSTAIDILLGLIEPESGSLQVDGEIITADKKRAWQNGIGFVPQAIFLADSSIRENIAFGVPPEQIDEKSVLRAAKMAHLEELLIEMPDGLDTRVGERGIQLSGGQRQRIGIARALYDDADVLVLDEATSALDGITEKLVMDAIHDFAGKKTIIMIAHRLATVKQCDCIYLLEQGQVVDCGTYEELEGRSSMFQKMAQHA